MIVGAGLYGATVARQALDAGRSVLVVDRRQHIGGNVYTEAVENIQVHRYGAHVFHTDDRRIWDYVNRFAAFHPFIHTPVANYRGELYALPFNMHTFHRMWGVVTPDEAAAKIAEQRQAAGIAAPRNLEEQAISLVGSDLYERLIRGYTEKQWGRPCRELPASIIRRLPVRFTFNTNYFDDRYQGIPVGGYTPMVARMLEGAEVHTGIDYLEDRQWLNGLAERVVYTGAIDAYFDYCLGALEYRSVRFETAVLDTPNFQGNAVVNYTDAQTPWIRIIEHQWFEGQEHPKTVISREYSQEWQPGEEPYYPINDRRNEALYAQYRRLALREPKRIFGGRLGEYRYYDMDETIDAALRMTAELQI